jgi:hypothetical protein
MDQAEGALSRAAPLRKHIRHQPAKLPLEALVPLSDDAMAKEIPEPDSLGG